MNTAILQKAIDALKESKPDISYIRGLLETLCELQPKPAQPNINPPLHFVPGQGVVPIQAPPKGPININTIAANTPPMVELSHGDGKTE